MLVFTNHLPLLKINVYKWHNFIHDTLAELLLPSSGEIYGFLTATTLYRMKLSMLIYIKVTTKNSLNSESNIQWHLRYSGHKIFIGHWQHEKVYFKHSKSRYD